MKNIKSKKTENVSVKTKKMRLSKDQKEFMSSRDCNKKFREKLIDLYNEKNIQLMVFEPGCFDWGVKRFGKKKDGYAVVYDYEKTAEALAEDYLKFNNSKDNDNKIEDYGFDEAYLDACEWIDFNTIRTIPYMRNGSGVAPMMVYTDEEGKEQIA